MYHIIILQTTAILLENFSFFFQINFLSLKTMINEDGPHRWHVSITTWPESVPTETWLGWVWVIHLSQKANDHSRFLHSRLARALKIEGDNYWHLYHPTLVMQTLASSVCWIFTRVCVNVVKICETKLALTLRWLKCHFWIQDNTTNGRFQTSKGPLR